MTALKTIQNPIFMKPLSAADRASHPADYIGWMAAQTSTALYFLSPGDFAGWDLSCAAAGNIVAGAVDCGEAAQKRS